MRMVRLPRSPMLFALAGSLLPSAGCHNRALQPTPRPIAPIAWTPVAPSGLPDASPYPSTLPTNPFDTRGVVASERDRSLEVAQAPQPLDKESVETASPLTTSNTPHHEGSASGDHASLATERGDSSPEPLASKDLATTPSIDSVGQANRPTASEPEEPPRRPTEEAPSIPAPPLVRLADANAAEPKVVDTGEPAAKPDAKEAAPAVSPIEATMPAPVLMASPDTEAPPDRTPNSAPQPRSLGEPVDPAPPTMPTPTLVESEGSAQPVSDPPKPRPRLQIATLKVCEEVRGFGEFEEIREKPLRPGQTVVIYCELESLRYEPTETGYRARFQSRLELTASSRNREQLVWSESLDEAEDLSRSARRDVYVNFRVTLPETLDSGHHLLRLALEDRLADSTAEMVIPVEILATP